MLRASTDFRRALLSLSSIVEIRMPPTNNIDGREELAELIFLPLILYITRRRLRQKVEREIE